MRLALPLYLAALVCPVYCSTQLVLQVSDLDDRPISGVVVSAKTGSSTSPPTDIAGKTQLSVVRDLQPGESLGLVLVRAPSKGLRFYSPWEGTATIPQANAAITIVLGVLGDRTALQNARVVSTLADTVTRQLRVNDAQAAPVPKVDVLSAVSKQLSLDPVQLDAAIRSLGTKTGPFKDSGFVLNDSIKGYVAIMPSADQVVKFKGIAKVQRNSEPQNKNQMASHSVHARQ